MLEQLMTAIQDGSFINYQGNIIKELENQDLLRKLVLQEKLLSQEIKQLSQQWKNEDQEHKNEVIEKQKLIQRHKEKLVKARTKADIETNYHDKEVKAKEGMESRIHNQKLTELESEIDHFERKKNVEMEVFSQISTFLKGKEAEIKAKVESWNQKLDRSEQHMDHDIQKLKNERDKALVKLEDLRKSYEMEEFEKRERERKYKEKEDDKKKAAEDEEKLDNAVKMIQDYYGQWKANGGTVGKKKKKEKKKK